MKTIIKSLIWLVTSLMLVIVLAARTYLAQNEYLIKFESACKEGQAIVLNGETTPETFSAFLVSHNYVNDSNEAVFISHIIIDSIRSHNGTLFTLKDLEHKKYGLELDDDGYNVISNYPNLLLRANEALSILLLQENCDKIPVSDASLSKRYTVGIRDKNKWGRLIRDTTYVCVKEHWNEKIYDENGKIIDCYSHDSVYACLPICGKSNIWLPVKTATGESRYFSVVPIDKGFTFGSPRGTHKKNAKSFSFVRKRAVLSLLSKDVLKKMRADNSVAVRSTIEYKDRYISTFCLFVTIWLLSFLFIVIVDKKRGCKSELRILSIISLLTGLGLVSLFNVQNPLWGELFAWAQLFKGLIPGICLLIVFSFVDWIVVFEFFRGRLQARGLVWWQGSWMAASALCIAVALMFFGEGPGGTHIELPIIGIQGSPIIKMLILCYMAVAFYNNRNILESYSSNGKILKQLIVLVTLVTVMLILGIMQVIISDLGPLLIIICTGLFLYSIYTHETNSMLIGSLLFVISLVVGAQSSIGGKYMPYMIFMLWLTIWLLYNYFKHGHIQVSAIILSVVILLTFYGGSIMDGIGLHDIATRLMGRTEMVTNTFMNQVDGGSQIAEAIWGVTRGGWWGNPGTGLSATIPVGYTDLAGVTLIENTGIIGFAMLLVISGLLITVVLRIGIRSGHAFAFNICSVFALCFGIQECIILFGSLGLIPLSGISLPFVSYGGSAMCVELASIGIIISLSRHHDHKLELINTQKYEFVSDSEIRAYAVMASIAFLTAFNYSIVSRDKYMVKEGIFRNKNGEWIVMYNPLKDVTLRKMEPGDIYDVKGNLIAGTNNNRRVYPYGENTFFMVGDYNTKTLWGGSGYRPAGLLAEERFFTIIRGYNTHPAKQKVMSHKHRSKYLPDVDFDKAEYVMIEDYSSLIPLMTSEIEIQKWNEKKYDRNIYLTFDADLQTAMQLRAGLFVRDNMNSGKTSSRTRIGIVVMDAFDFSLLTSSVYPLPDQDIIRERAQANATIYRDWASDFTAFSDMDLGLAEPLAPGSTIKIISAGAGLNRFSTRLATSEFNQYVYEKEIVDTYLGEPTENVTLSQAIIKSSNVYFIKLVNKYGESGLYPELGESYYAIGAKFGNSTPYVLYPDEVLVDKDVYCKQVKDFGRKAAKKYAEYEASGKKHRLIDAEYQPAWGQGDISMTPISLCRYVAAVANGGKMMRPRYVSNDTIAVFRQLLSEDEAQVLQECMKGQAAGRFGELSSHIGGKTGTPTRTDKASTSGKSNDALYAFFVDASASANSHPIAVVIRMERVNDYSRLALKMAHDVVIPVLREQGYIL